MESFNIELNGQNKLLNSGGLLEGQCCLACNDTLIAKGFKVVLKGIMDIHLIQQEDDVKMSLKSRTAKVGQRPITTRRRTPDGNHTYLQVVNIPTEVLIEGGKLLPGTYELPFSLRLLDDMPSSYQGPDVSIVYKIEAHLPNQWLPKEGSGDQNVELHLPVSVRERIDCNHNNYNFTLEGTDKLSYSTFCCGHEPDLSIDVSTDRAAFVPGEKIALKLSAVNSTSHPKKIDVRLIQRVLLDHDLHNKKTSQWWELKSADNIEKQSDDLLDDPIRAAFKSSSVLLDAENYVSWLSKQFLIPDANVITPSIQVKSVFSVSYYIELAVKDLEDHDDAAEIAVYLPIVIGTLPFVSIQVEETDNPEKAISDKQGRRSSLWSGISLEGYIYNQDYYPPPVFPSSHE